MELRSSSDNTKKLSEINLPTASLISTLPIIIDDQSPLSSADEDSNGQTRTLNFTTTEDDHSFNPRKSMPIRDPKSHRMIEKRRRDRMNNCLADLLRLIPQDKPDGQRRVEKAEIIEMATKHIQQMMLISTSKCKILDEEGILSSSVSKKRILTSSTDLDFYQRGYQDSLDDVRQYLIKQSTSDLDLTDLLHDFKRKKYELRDPIALSKNNNKRRNSSLTSDDASPSISPRQEQISHMNNNKQSNSLSVTDDEDDDSCCLFNTTQVHNQNALKASTTIPNEQQQTATISFSNPVATAPIFVLHPSGSHYIPMCIDASIVSHAFENHNASSSATGEPLRCHPVSIPVNFHPISALSDPYELDIQNINVIGVRHQTSVRPN